MLASAGRRDRTGICFRSLTDFQRDDPLVTSVIASELLRELHPGRYNVLDHWCDNCRNRRPRCHVVTPLDQLRTASVIQHAMRRAKSCANIKSDVGKTNIDRRDIFASVYKLPVHIAVEA